MHSKNVLERKSVKICCPRTLALLTLSQLQTMTVLNQALFELLEHEFTNLYCKDHRKRVLWLILIVVVISCCPMTESNGIFAFMEFNFLAYINWAFVTECTCNQVKFEISLTFSEHKFAFPDFYLPSSLCGTAGTGWIWPQHNKRLKVNILQFEKFEKSKYFSKFQKTGRNASLQGILARKVF